MGREMISNIRPANDGLDDIGCVTTCFESLGSDGGEV